MEVTTLLSLPTEVLDKVFSYIDWDRSQSLQPCRPDIISVSLTCRHLRKAVLSRVFENMTLVLRWIDGALVEPTLFRLRRSHPHLANYVRSVYIRTQFQRSNDPASEHKDFMAPEAISTWLGETVDTERYNRFVETAHQERVASLVKSFFERNAYPELPTGRPPQVQDVLSFGHKQHAEMLKTVSKSSTSDSQPRIGEGALYISRPPRNEAVSASAADRYNLVAHRQARLESDALLIVVLCLPPSTESLSFESLHARGSHLLQNIFALQVAAMALECFGNRLQALTMITSPEQQDGIRPTSTRNPSLDELRAENAVITAGVLGNLTELNTLVISDDYRVEYDDYRAHFPHARAFSPAWQVEWHTLAPTLTQLELWNMQCNCSETFKHIIGFGPLQQLALKNIMLTDVSRFDPTQPANRSHDLVWLNLLIEIRRQRPGLEIRLDNIKQRGDTNVAFILPTSALLWLLREAIPLGWSVDFDRETRLAEDFVSFWPLWDAEDSVRGAEAKEARKDGSLVDTAMTNRWRTFKHLR